MFKQYPKNSEEGFTADEIKRGIHTLYMDVECPHCGKWQSVAQTGYMGGPCICCLEYTDGRKREYRK